MVTGAVVTVIDITERKQAEESCGRVAALPFHLRECPDRDRLISRSTLRNTFPTMHSTICWVMGKMS